MGTWGFGVFSNDCSADVQEEYRDLVAGGMSGFEATDSLLDTYASTVDDPDEGPDFWVGLAAAQAKVGRLEDRVRDRALAVIDDGGDVARFAGADRARRHRELLKVRAVLLGPQRPPVMLKAPTKSVCPFTPGDVLEYLTADHHRFLLVVQGVHSDRGGDSAWLAVLDWTDAMELPAPAAISTFPLVEDLITHSGSKHLGFIASCTKKADHSVVADRVRVLSTVPQDAAVMLARTSGWGVSWRDLDTWFGGGTVHFPGR